MPSGSRPPRIRRRSTRRAGAPDRSTGSSSPARTPSTTSCAACSRRGDVRDLHGVRLCTVGPSTASRLQRYGIRVDLTPAEFRADALIDALQGVGQPERTTHPDAARRHRARSPRARSCARPGPTSWTSSPTGRFPAERERERRLRRLPHAARSPDRRRHVCQRLGGQELRRDARPGAGRRPAAVDRRGIHRAGDRRSRAAARHRRRP